MKSLTRLIPAIAVVLIATTPLAFADTPDMMTVQGRLTDTSGAPLPAGFKSFTFKIFDSAVGGTEIWPAGSGESHILNTDDDGLWTAEVGSIAGLPDSVFSDPDRWLEVTVDDGVNPAETLSRVRVTSDAFAHRVATVDGATGGIISGDVSIQSDLTVDGTIDATGMSSKIRFHYNDLGDLPSPGSYHGMFAHVHNTGKAYYAHAGAWIPLADESHTHDFVSGIAQARDTVTINYINVPGPVPTMIDLVTVTITTPADGYIFVRGQALVHMSGATAANYSSAQIDETAGGGIDAGHYTLTGSSSWPNTGIHYHNVTPSRVYFKAAGTYTFRMEANNSSTGVVGYWFSKITAFYIPVSYGTVETIAESMGEAPLTSASMERPVPGPGDPEPGVIDLRMLELEAQRARAEAAEAEKRLLEAQLEAKQQNDR